MFGIRKNPSRTSSLIFVVSALQILVYNRSTALRLTNMTAPVLQDPRKDMELHCRFDMGGEELYAIKWYKDDHEFFRYSPAAPVPITQFPVEGVRVESQRTRCMPNGCDLLLTKLSRPQSSGAYRCEVSSEAPAFRLASQTQNVTVAAIPAERPKLEGLNDNYLIGDLLEIVCASGLGDPKPKLTWYVNKKQIVGKTIQELPSPSRIENGVQLKSTILQLKMPLDKKLAQNRTRTPLEITCVSSAEGINQAVAPPQASTKNIMLLDQNQLVNNQKLHSPFSSAKRLSVGGWMFVFVLTTWSRWC